MRNAAPWPVMAVRRTVPADPLHKRFTPNSHRICEMSSGRPPTMVQDDRATARARGMDRAVPRVPGSPGGTLRRPVLVPPQCPSGSPVARTADQACRSYSPRARPSGARRAVRPGATGRRLVTSGSTRRHERMWTGRRCGGGLPWAGGPARGASGSGPLAPPAGQPLTGRGEQVPRLAPRRHSSRTSRPDPRDPDIVRAKELARRSRGAQSQAGRAQQAGPDGPAAATA